MDEGRPHGGEDRMEGLPVPVIEGEGGHEGMGLVLAHEGSRHFSGDQGTAWTVKGFSGTHEPEGGEGAPW